ncbi:MAG: hypothetical protein MMC33_006131 [Icmadophila ericetorum]|nr:hypothetical protein [Icmadophila ericetorum]
MWPQYFSKGSGNSSLVVMPYLQVKASAKDKDTVEEIEREGLLLSAQNRVTTKRQDRWLLTLFLGLNIVGLIVIYLVLEKTRPPPFVNKFFPPGIPSRKSCKSTIIQWAELNHNPSAARYEERRFHLPDLRPGLEADTEWEDALPKGAGFTIVDEPARLHLPSGMAYKEGYTMYGVSWSHQYHCIWMLRREFWALIQQNSTLAGIGFDDNNEEAKYLRHLAHCFGYIRELIVCNMDMTLEYPTLGGVKDGVVNGYEIPHQCVRRERWDDFMNLHAPDYSATKGKQAPKKHHYMSGR